MVQRILDPENDNGRPFFAKLSSSISCLLHDFDVKTGTFLNSSTFRPHFNNWRKIEIGGKNFYVIFDEIFKQILEDNLLSRAIQNYPDSFGTEDPYKVLEALYKTAGIHIDTSSQENLIRQLSYFTIISEENDMVLRIPLFRTIGIDEDSKIKALEFKNGFLHTLQHYQLDGQALSGKSETQELPENFILEIIKCVYFQQPVKTVPVSVSDSVLKAKGVDKLENKIIHYNVTIDGKNYLGIFYYSDYCKVLFLSTFHRK